ncbi:MAG: phosphotransferase [Chloroflexi bacterium]|nr:phosphotransferase [Chloroflexota bacterium]
MSNSKDGGVDVQQARLFLTNHLTHEPADVALIGEGAWSRCFGFRQGAEALVIRFGNHVDDFQKDQSAYAFAAPGLPIPQVLEIGEAFGGYYAISTRAYGVPLESLGASEWLAIVPAVVSALEAMRTTDLSATTGVGGWGVEGKASHSSWSSHLLAVGEENPNLRTYGWRERLRAAPEADATFRWGLDLLHHVVNDAAPRALIHGDLVNRNVLVHEANITGVFDWGCSRFGDHLYDLAWFEFWAPWFPQLDMQALRLEIEKRWHEVGYLPQDKGARVMACYLHIGLDHLAYNAYLGDWPELSNTAARMRTLVATVQA